MRDFYAVRSAALLKLQTTPDCR